MPTEDLTNVNDSGKVAGDLCLHREMGSVTPSLRTNPGLSAG